MSLTLSNLDVYRSIAEEALAESQRLDGAARTPRPDGQPGYIIAFDPDRTSFKQSLIALAFAGIYFEALLYLAGVALIGKPEYEQIERNNPSEYKLQLLGICDPDTLAACTRFRLARNDLVHEKAVLVQDLGSTRMHRAQTEAELGLTFVKNIHKKLRRALDSQ